MDNTLTCSSPLAKEPARSGSLHLWPTVGFAVLATLLMSLPNVLDPMIRHDDFPAFFADPEPFWNKTLHEGRWINYLWHLREMVTPSWLNFAIYQVFWAVFAGAIAVATIGSRENQWFATVLALVIVAAHSATQISLWFNTLMPGLATVALYAVLGCTLTPRAHRLLLPPFVIASFMAYTTYPLLLLAVCLVRTRDRSIADLAGLLILFVLSFAAAVLSVYAINLQVHGIFGVPLAEWRNASPAHDVAGLVANFSYFVESLELYATGTSFTFDSVIIFHLTMLSLATIFVARAAPLEALYLHAGLWMGLALVAAQNLKLGVIVPPRAFMFAWVCYAVLLVRAAQHLGNRSELLGRIARNLVLLIFVCHFLANVVQYSCYRAWQSETRAIAESLADAPQPVLIKGNVMEMPSAKAAYVQLNVALPFRLRQVAGIEAILCEDDPGYCDELEAGWAAGKTSAGTVYRVETEPPSPQ